MRELKSDNYNPGLQGWRISADGEAEFQDGVFRGKIVASEGKIGGWNIGTDKLYGSGILEGGTIRTSTMEGGTIRTSTSGNRIELSRTNQLRAFSEGIERVRIDPYQIRFWTSNGDFAGGIFGGVLGDSTQVIYLGGTAWAPDIVCADSIICGGGIDANESIAATFDVMAYRNMYCTKLYESGCPIKIEEEEAIEGLRKIEGEEKFLPTEVSKRLKTKKYTRIKYETLPEYALMPTDKFKEKLEAQLKDDKLKKDKSKIEEKLKELPPYSINKDALLSMLIFAMQNIDKRLQKLEENYAKSK